MTAKTKYVAWLAGLILIVSGVVACLRWDSISAWYQVRALSTASADQLDWHINRIEKLGLPGIESVVSLLQSEDQQVCQNASVALNHLLRQLKPTSDNAQDSFRLIENQLKTMSSQGRQCVNKLFHSLAVDEPYLRADNAPAMLGLVRLTDFPDSREAAYDTLLEVIKSGESLQREIALAVQTAIRKGIQDKSSQVRSTSVRLAVCASVLMHDELVPMLAQNSVEVSPEIRQLVILALGEHEALLPTEELCRFLNDESQEVVNTTMRALKVRGLSEGQIRIAQKMKSRDVTVRAEVPDFVLKTKGIDSYLWLERLSKDPEPAVRAAVARVLSEQEDQQMTKLLKSLTLDQDPTVQEISLYYFRKRQ